MVLLLHGDVAGAFKVQPLVMSIFCLAIPTCLFLRIFSGKKIGTVLASIVRRPLFWYVCAIVVLADWIYLIMSGI